MKREVKVERMRQWLHRVPEANKMIGAALKRNGVASIAELAEKHPKQFNSLFIAVETMEAEMPEPEFPWPSV